VGPWADKPVEVLFAETKRVAKEGADAFNISQLNLETLERLSRVVVSLMGPCDRIEPKCPDGWFKLPEGVTQVVKPRLRCTHCPITRTGRSITSILARNAEYLLEKFIEGSKDSGRKAPKQAPQPKSVDSAMEEPTKNQEETGSTEAAGMPPAKATDPKPRRKTTNHARWNTRIQSIETNLKKEIQTRENAIAELTTQLVAQKCLIKAILRANPALSASIGLNQAPQRAQGKHPTRSVHIGPPAMALPGDTVAGHGPTGHRQVTGPHREVPVKEASRRLLAAAQAQAKADREERSRKNAQSIRDQDPELDERISSYYFITQETVSFKEAKDAIFPVTRSYGVPDAAIVTMDYIRGRSTKVLELVIETKHKTEILQSMSDIGHYSYVKDGRPFDAYEDSGTYNHTLETFESCKARIQHNMESKYMNPTAKRFYRKIFDLTKQAEEEYFPNQGKPTPTEHLSNTGASATDRSEPELNGTPPQSNKSNKSAQPPTDPNERS